MNEERNVCLKSLIVFSIENCIPIALSKIYDGVSLSVLKQDQFSCSIQDKLDLVERNGLISGVFWPRSMIECLL